MDRFQEVLSKAHETLSNAPTPRYNYFRTNWRLIEERLQQLGYSHLAYFPSLCSLLPHREQDILSAVHACINSTFTPDTTARFLTLYKDCVKEALGQKEKEVVTPE